jgi:hypothetical protein
MIIMKIAPVCASIGLAVNASLLSCAIAAAAISPGDLVVSELMANPAAVSDTAGEWFELYNTSASSIDINGLVLRDNGSNHHTISNPVPLLLAPGDYRVLGRNGDPASNGGYLPDYIYSDFTLANSSDAIILESGGVEIFRLSYSSGDNFGEAGISMALTQIPQAISAADYSASDLQTVFGSGDRGSPGSGSLGSTEAVAEVPIPAAGLLFCSSLGLLAGIKRRRGA